MSLVKLVKAGSDDLSNLLLLAGTCNVALLLMKIIIKFRKIWKMMLKG